MLRWPTAATPRRASVLLLALALAAFGAPGAAGASGARSTAAAVRAHASSASQGKAPGLRFTFGPGLLAAPGRTVAMQPVGLSIEYPTMAAALGSGPCAPAALVQALQRLGSPPLQLAGASQDMTAPSGALKAPAESWETATLYSLPSSFWSQMRCLLEASKDPLTVGLNLKTGSAAWARQMVSEAGTAAVDGLSFSLGNEPDLYPLPNYASLDKPLPDEALAAANLYIQLAGALRSVVAGAPTIGPELAIAQRWRAQLPRVLSALGFATVGVHLYPLSTCPGTGGVTLGALLTEYAGDAPEAYGWVVADARADGLPAIISEANSVSCGGAPGISDSAASAVWAVRFTLSALRTGFREVRFHFSGNSYDPFVVRGSTVLQRPLDSALVALNQWLPPGSVVHQVRVALAQRVRASAVAQPGGGIVLLLDNRAPHTQQVLLRSAHPLAVQILSAARAGLQQTTLTPISGRATLSLPASSVAAVSRAGGS